MVLAYTMNYSGESGYKWMDHMNYTEEIDDQEYPYCGEMKKFQENFTLFHGYFSIIVCIFGIVTNILNIIVLTRKDMVTPTNAILTGLAVADMLVMVDYLPFSLLQYILVNQPKHVKFSYHWAVFILFHAHFTVVCHTISIALTVCLAVWRYIAVSLPAQNRTLCSMPRAYIAIASSYLFPVVFCVPAYLVFTIREEMELGPDNKEVVGMLYFVDQSDIGRAHNGLLQKINFWTYSVMVKLIPCIALTMLSLSLIHALYQANQRKLNLLNRPADSAQDRSCDRTNRMLLAVLLLFLLTEFPQGILALLSGILGDKFFEDCYQSFAEVMDILALINSAINFILYCTMSRQFRATFSQLFKPRILNKWIAIPQDPHTVATTCV